MKNRKLTDVLLWLLPAVAVILNAMPWCVRLRFAAGPEEIVYEYFSGFSLIPVGYALWSPMITGICAVILTAMGLFHARSHNPRLIKWMMSIALVGLLMGVTSLALGIATAVSTLVALAVGAEAVLIYRLREDM